MSVQIFKTMAAKLYEDIFLTKILEFGALLPKKLAMLKRGQFLNQGELKVQTYMSCAGSVYNQCLFNFTKQ